MSYYYGGVSDSIFEEQPYLEITSTETQTKKTFTIKFGIRAITKAITAGYTAKGTLTGNLEWKSYSKTITSTLSKGSHFQIGSITIEKEKYNGSTREFSVQWDGHLDANAQGSYVSGAHYYEAISAITTYTISYNVNGGSGTISSQTKVYGKSLTLTTTKPTRTGYNFVKWNTSSNGSGTNYASGGTYTANAGAILYAQWSPVTYTVSYNANGGTGAPANQTKTYNVTLKLSSIKPTRTDYNFVSWNEKADGTGTPHGAGTNYTTNKAVTLYAIWEKAYKPPTINNLTAYRMDTTQNKNDEGTQFNVDFTWGAGSDAYGSVSLSSVIIKWKKTTESDYSSNNTFSANITSTDVSVYVNGSNVALEIDAQYNIQIIVTPTSLSSSTIHPDITCMSYISTSSFIIDINTAGNAIGIGMAAPDGDTNGNPITGNSQLHIGSDIYLNSNNAFKKDITVEKSSSWDTPKVIVAQNDENNNLTAKGALTSTYGGNFGLYDQKHNKWLIRSDTDGRPHIGFSPYTLHSTKVACTKVGTAYENTTISGLANWNIVAVYFVVHQQTRLLWFIRGIQTDISLTDVPSAGYFRGTIFVDWTNNRISMRCVNAGTSGTNYNLVYFQGVYGIM